MGRVEIRVMGRDREAVETWAGRVAAMVRAATEGTVYQHPARLGDKGDYLAYIGIHPPTVEPVAAVRLPRKNGSLSNARRRRARR
jgi:hypothetical protein